MNPTSQHFERPAVQHDIVVLGGGLAGLSASMESGAPVFEAAAAVGGVGSSDTVDGFTFDRGIHVLNTKSAKFMQFLTDMDIEMGVRDRIAHIYSHKRYTAYPFQVNTAGLPLSLRAQCVWGYLRRGTHPEPKNYSEWMYSTIGRTFADKFLIPYSQKFWGVDPREMTFEWTGTKVPKTSMWHVLRGALWSRQTAVGSNAVFHYPQNGPGYGTIAAAIAARAGEKHTDHRVVRLDVDNRIVTFENGRSVGYRILVSTIPTTRLVALTRDAPEPVTQAAGKLRSNSIMVVNLGIKRPGISEKHWVHFPEDDVSFFRISFPHNFSSRVCPPGHSSVSAEVSYPSGSRPDPAALIERVAQDLRKVGVLRAGDEIVTRHTHDIPIGYCIYDPNRKPSMRAIRDWYEQRDVILGGRFGLWTYFWSDEAINSGLQSGRKALKLMKRLKVMDAATGAV